MNSRTTLRSNKSEAIRKSRQRKRQFAVEQLNNVLRIQPRAAGFGDVSSVVGVRQTSKRDLYLEGDVIDFRRCGICVRRRLTSNERQEENTRYYQTDRSFHFCFSS